MQQKHHHEEGYEHDHSINGIHISDFDKRVIEERIKMDNRKWIFDTIVKSIVGFAIGLFLAKFFNG